MAGSSKSIIAVQLHRDAFKKPWGFRLQGGAEFGEYLSVQRVFMGSPSEGVIHRGDTILRINDLDCSQLRVQDAEKIVNNTALTLRLEVLRSGASSTPVSPQPMFQKQSSRQPPQAQGQAQQSPPAWFGSPTMQAIQRQTSAVDRRAPRWEQEDIAEVAAVPPGIRNLVEAERSKKSGVLDYTVPLPNPDHLSVKNQTYRSSQLISPAPKARHYRPMGSYLDASFGRKPAPEPRIIHDSHYATPAPGLATRSFNRGQQRPQSVYDFASAGVPNQYASSNQLSPRIHQRQASVSPSPRTTWTNQQAPQKEIVLGGRQWPPNPPVPSPPPQSVPSNPFSFSNANYGVPSQTGSYYQQPQSPKSPPYNYNRPQQQQQQQQVFNTANPSRKVIHSNYNSPAGLYSAQNANAMFTGQTGLRDAEGMLHVNQPPPSKQLSDISQSPTYQFLAQSQGQRGGTAWGHNPRQSRVVQSLVSDL